MTSQPGPYPQPPQSPPQNSATQQYWGQAPQYAPPAPQYAAPTYAKPRQPMPKLDVTAGLLLFGAVAVAMIGSFQNAYKIVYQDGGFFYSSTNWLYQTGQSDHVQSTRVLVSGFLLAMASAVALVAGVLLVTGLGRQSTTVRGFGCAGAGLMVGVATINVLNPLDSMRLSEGQSSLRSWSLGSGFWLTVVATVIALAALVVSVLSLRKPRPAFGWNPGTAQPQYAYAQAAYTAQQPYAPTSAAGYQPQWGGQAQQAQPQQAQPQQAQPQQYQPQPPQQVQYPAQVQPAQHQAQPQPQYQSQQAAAVPPTAPQQPRPASPPPTIPEQPVDTMPTMRTAVLQPMPQTDAVPSGTTPPPTGTEPAAGQLTHVTPIPTDRLPSPAQIREEASDS